MVALRRVNILPLISPVRDIFWSKDELETAKIFYILTDN
jgi:hypothetical protein